LFLQPELPLIVRCNRLNQTARLSPAAASQGHSKVEGFSRDRKQNAS
jgi:hypothetical protein